MSQHQKRLRDPLRYTLTELEEHDWGPPNHQSSLVQTVHRLRNVPLKEFDAGNLRIMIGQNVGLGYLVPIALDILEKDAFVEGTYHRGDLLNAVVNISPTFWNTHAHLKSQIINIASAALEAIDTADVIDEMKGTLTRFLESTNTADEGDR